MDNEQAAFINEAVEYILKRVKTENNSIPRYLRKISDGKLSIRDFINNIIVFSEEFLDLEENKNIIPMADDELFYIVDKTGYSTEIIQLVLWYKECYLMETDCCVINGKCPECGFDELFIREVKGSLYESYIECGNCKKKLSYSDVTAFNYNEDDDDDDDDEDFDWDENDEDNDEDDDFDWDENDDEENEENENEDYGIDWDDDDETIDWDDDEDDDEDDIWDDDED